MTGEYVGSGVTGESVGSGTISSSGGGVGYSVGSLVTGAFVGLSVGSSVTGESVGSGVISSTGAGVGLHTSMYLQDSLSPSTSLAQQSTRVANISWESESVIVSYPLEHLVTLSMVIM